MTATAPRAGALPTIPVMRPWLGPEEAAAAADAVVSGWVAQGPRVQTFERAVAARVGAAEGVATSSCTTALHLALVLAGVGVGDEVVVPSLSFIATANVCRYVGARPVFADVDACTLGLTAASVEAVLTERTRAVILVHQCGTPAETAPIRELCERRGVVLVEDAACALGATYRGEPVGAHSDLAAFSFHPRKVITTGEGGMLVTSRADWAARARRLREHGMSISAAERHTRSPAALEQYLEPGFNYRMTDIQAAVGLVQLDRLDVIVTRRRDLGRRYREMLTTVPGLVTNADPADGTTNFQSFWMLLPDGFPITRNELLSRLSEQGISARRGIMAAHLEPAYRDAVHTDLPVTERVTRDSLILPLFHDMTVEEQDRVVDAVLTPLARAETP
jgi:dTDP-4-amino-4,6-dideoxygalactose transaminase